MVKSRRNMRKNKNMRGGVLTEQQEKSLSDLHFSPGQVSRLNDLDITYEQIQQKISEFNGPPDELPDFVDNYFLNNEVNENPNAEPMQIIGANEYDEDDEDDVNGDPLNMSDLSIGSRNSGYTTKESGALDESGAFGEFGGKKRHRKTVRRTMRKNKKHSKSRKTHKTRKHKRKYSYKQKGGICYGNGIGANNYDPNFSIYNTQELKLFPYRPTN